MITLRTTMAAFVIGTFAVAGSALGQIEDNAKAVLTRSAEAIKGFKDLSATSRKYATGPFVQGMIDTGGEFKLIKGTDKAHSPGSYKGRAKSAANPNDEVFNFFLDVEGTTQTVTWTDDHAKVVYIRPLTVRTEQFNQLTLGQELLIPELFEAEPFRKELAAQKLVLEGTEEFGGEKCDIVRATYNANTWGLWHISTVDNLPRRSEMGVKLEDQEEPIRIIIELTAAKANQNLTRKDLAFKAPEGYREDKQLATAQPNPANPGEPVVVPPPPELGPARASGAPAFDLRGPDDKAVTLASLSGNVVVLGFSDPRNGMSARALTVLETVHKAFAEKPVKVFAAACRDKTNDGTAGLMKEKGATFGLLLGADDVAKAYKVRGFPSFAVIDAQGNVSEFIQGMRTEDDLRERLTNAVRAALGETATDGN